MKYENERNFSYKLSTITIIFRLPFYICNVFKAFLWLVFNFSHGKSVTSGLNFIHFTLSLAWCWNPELSKETLNQGFKVIHTREKYSIYIEQNYLVVCDRHTKGLPFQWILRSFIKCPLCQPYSSGCNLKTPSKLRIDTTLIGMGDQWWMKAP
jgi:hypothetical protein